ncbi:MAG: hypothetical protein IRZ28_01530 [Steroidobacteraceae bacterium]|nr:hypothetical protein [Steroidobacteraceae bacterium]
MNDRESAMIYLAALAFPKARGEFELFCESVRLCATNPTRKLDKKYVSSINRATKAIYELRVPAAMVANMVEMRVVRAISAGTAIQIDTALDTVQKAIKHYAPRAPKYRHHRDFRRHVWDTSTAVLHLALGFGHHALNGEPLPLLPLIANPHWVEAAVRNAKFHGGMLAKSIDGLELVTLCNEDNLTADMFAQLPDVRYRRSGKWGDLTD